MNQFLSQQIDASTIRMLIFVGGIIFFLIIELIVPYRSSSASKVKRWGNNLSLAFFNSLILYLVFSTTIITTAHYVTNNKLGVMNLEQMSGLPHWLRILLIIVVLDFVLYIWHVLNHIIPLFWRFHRVHHSDINMDVSTATRFHIGELAISAVIKIALIFFIGPAITTVIIYESAVVFCAQFHHSSLKVPKWLEYVLWILFVPPSMHRIHHSVIRKEMDSNYGTIFSVWDRIVGTLVTRVDQGTIRIGIGEYQDTAKLNFHNLMVMPFTKPV
jgi:sterol desaturase/sphingolipid hydroxylase (fatty acid hydroxylase superfamily)